MGKASDEPQVPTAEDGLTREKIVVWLSSNAGTLRIVDFASILTVAQFWLVGGFVVSSALIVGGAGFGLARWLNESDAKDCKAEYERNTHDLQESQKTALAKQHKNDVDATTTELTQGWKLEQLQSQLIVSSVCWSDAKIKNNAADQAKYRNQFHACYKKLFDQNKVILVRGTIGDHRPQLELSDFRSSGGKLTFSVPSDLWASAEP